MLFKIIRASFNQRRKTLQNGLNNSSELNFTKDQIAAAIAAAEGTSTDGFVVRSIKKSNRNKWQRA